MPAPCERALYAQIYFAMLADRSTLVFSLPASSRSALRYGLSEPKSLAALRSSCRVDLLPGDGVRAWVVLRWSHPSLNDVERLVRTIEAAGATFCRDMHLGDVGSSPGVPVPSLAALSLHAPPAAA